jgi:hypothetical protein
LFAGLKVAAPPAQAQAPPSAMPLLTPQFLLNQQQQSAPAPEINQGAKLLQRLRSSSSSAMPVAASIDPHKVSALLKSLAENEVFCTELAKEMKQCLF